MEKLSLSWQDVEHLVLELARQIHISGWRPDIIIGIDRGGLPASIMLSHYLEVPHETVKVSLRDGGVCESVMWAPSDAMEGRQILLVDDINDSGATQAWLREDWAGCVEGVDPDFDKNHWHQSVRFAALVTNEASPESCDYAAMSINKMERDVWIDFPWESWWSRSTV